MSKKNQLSRRSFIKTTGLAAAGASTLSAKSYSRILGANDRLNTAIVGCGGIARSHLSALLRLRESDNIEISAVCDVYKSRAQGFQDQILKVGGNPESHQDYRKVLEMSGIDYITIATPEHQHCVQTLAALDTGRHVYCEKPITRTVDEAHEVLDKVRATGLKMQVGVQGMSDDSYSSANTAIREGAIGPVIQAQIDYVRNHSAGRGPWRTGVSSDAPQPADLDWDAWLGSAPKRGWDPHRYYEWRCYQEYSGGIATDLFIHRLSRIMRACDLTYPKHIVGMGGITLWDDGRDLPDNFELMAEYPAIEGISPGMNVYVLGTMGNRRRNDHVIRGHKGSLVFNREGWEIHDEETRKVTRKHKKTGAEDIFLHHQNLHAAIRSGKPLNCPAEFGVYGITTVAGANRSWAESKLLKWDPERRNWV